MNIDSYHELQGKSIFALKMSSFTDVSFKLFFYTIKWGKVKQCLWISYGH